MVGLSKHNSLFVKSVEFHESTPIFPFVVRLVRGDDHLGIKSAGIVPLSAVEASGQLLSVQVLYGNAPQQAVLSEINGMPIVIDLITSEDLVKGMTTNAVAAVAADPTPGLVKQVAAVCESKAKAAEKPAEKPAAKAAAKAAPATKPAPATKAPLTDVDDIGEVEYEDAGELFDDSEEEPIDGEEMEEIDVDSDEEFEEVEVEVEVDADSDATEETVEEVEITAEELQAYILKALKAKTMAQLQAIAEELSIDISEAKDVPSARDIITTTLSEEI